MRSCAGHRALFIAAAELEYIGLADFIAKQALCLLGTIPKDIKDITKYEYAAVHGFA
jgi:hypothetical protein